MDDDALIIDAVYRDQPGLASTLALFGEHQYMDGSLIAAGPMRDTERAVIALLQQGMELEEALKMCSLYPAKVMGLETQLGKIEKGYKAKIVVLDKNLELVKMVS